jgi:hypothetical protein
MNLPQTILASSAQSMRCWSVPSAGCLLLAKPVSEATIVASRARLATRQTFDALLIVILFPEVERVETRCGKPIIHLALACNGPTVAWQPQPRHRQFPFVAQKNAATRRRRHEVTSKLGRCEVQCDFYSLSMMSSENRFTLFGIML